MMLALLFSGCLKKRSTNRSKCYRRYTWLEWNRSKYHRYNNARFL